MKANRTETRKQNSNIELASNVSIANKSEDLPTRMDNQNQKPHFTESPHEKSQLKGMMVVPRIVRVEWNPSGVMRSGQDEPCVKVETLPLSRDEEETAEIDDDIEISELKNEMFSSSDLGQYQKFKSSTPIRSSCLFLESMGCLAASTSGRIRVPEKILAGLKLNGEKYFVIKWMNSRENELGKFLVFIFIRDYFDFKY